VLSLHSPALAGTLRVLAIRVSFPQETPDDETTSGDGTFDLRTPVESLPDYRFPFDTPPHDRAYFEAHLQALSNYYRVASEGRLEIEYDVYPTGATDSYPLATALKDYGNGRSRQEIAERITRLFRDGVLAADAAEGNALDFSQYQSVAVWHAGLGGESSQALNDIPSAYVSAQDLDQFAGGPVLVDNGSWSIPGGMLLPEAVSVDGRGGLNGTLARFFANQLGLPGLSNFEDDLPGVGDWSLMDTGANNLASARDLGLASLQGSPADTILVGYIPSRMLAWSRMQLGWLTPPTVARSDTVLVVAPHVDSDLPQAVKIPISADEYFLLENRVSRLRLSGRVPQIAFSRGDDGGVWLSCDDHDAFIPGSGLLIWHIDDAVIRAAAHGAAVNSNPQYRIGMGQYRRGVSLEEADGLEDIGNVTAGRIIQSGIISLDTIEGGPLDPFYAGGNARFGPDTHPDTRSNLGYRTGISIEVLSAPGDTMRVAVRFSEQRGSWPVTGLPDVGLQSPRVADVDGNGAFEILRAAGAEASTACAFSVDGGPIHHIPYLDRHTTPALGQILPGSPSQEIVTASGDDRCVAFLWHGGSVDTTRVSWPDRPAPYLSAAPLVAAFADAGATDIWGWSHGFVGWGYFAQGAGSADLGVGPVTALAAGDVGPGAGPEIVALVGGSRLFVVEADGSHRELTGTGSPVVGSPVLADLDRDTDEEIVVVHADGAISIADRDGIILTSDPLPGGASSSPALGDLDGDGFVEVLFGGHGRLWAVRFNGVRQTGAPLAFPVKDRVAPIVAPPVIADLDGDGSADIVVASQGGLVYGLRSDGSPLPGFPLATGGPVLSSPLLQDLDADGTLELVAFTGNGAIHLWHLEAVNPSLTGNEVVWGEFGGGPGNAGRLQQAPRADPPAPSDPLLPSGRAYCYPNPSRHGSARLRFFLGDQARVRVTVYNAVAEVVDRLSLENPVPRTDNEIAWDVRDYASGLYVCRLEALAGGRSAVRFIKAAVIK